MTKHNKYCVPGFRVPGFRVPDFGFAGFDGDPFDRLLLATARAEGMTLLTRDAALARYGQGVRLI